MPEFHSDLPPMAPPPTLPRQRIRYTRILEVAAGFARKGLDSVVLSEVAARADVPLGTLYRYFPSATQLVLALYRKQLGELLAGSPQAAGHGAAGVHAPGEVPAHALAGAVMEIFHMRLMQPAVEQSLNRVVYVKDTDTTRLLREIDSIAEKAVTAVSGDAAISRVLLLTVTGLVQAVRCRRLSLFEAEEDLKKACSLLSKATEAA
ncbi:TetR/AcrR family transcriptional regulator [Arthrobacter sp. PAMC25564]|uniref:helix-turn-helix domain-containing protein n=1 Tax=Arthrobacter sp. PAMC25564 TaxID=2565366 RepID=UPI0010A21CAB|nr:TetR/AcrR family transcriptional regulator [Arthrobacter sp. PAMC25564]QCB96164.1 TetR/AcrR family transcriptional regulator [Arthrobacter sp. PAMC25564]